MTTPSPNPLRKALEDFVTLAEGHLRAVRAITPRELQGAAEQGRSALAADDAAGGWWDISTARARGAHWLGDQPFGDRRGVVLYFDTETEAKEFLNAYEAALAECERERDEARRMLAEADAVIYDQFHETDYPPAYDLPLQDYIAAAIARHASRLAAAKEKPDG